MGMFVCGECGKRRCNGHLLTNPDSDPHAKVMYMPALAFTDEDWKALEHVLERRAQRAAEASDAEEGA